MSRIKRFVAALCCLCVIFTSFLSVYAKEYEKSGETKDGDKTATYYILKGKSYDKLFDLKITDIKSGQDMINWVFNFKSFTVIKKWKDKDGKTYYKGYFNAPNLQMQVKNGVMADAADGFTDGAYKVEDTEWLVKVGSHANTENAITRYGFSIPSYYYMGEYPNTQMSTANLVMNMTKICSPFFALKALFGASFIDAPDASSFNTITYDNHTYIDKEDRLSEFIQNYWIPYFVARIGTNDSRFSKKGNYTDKEYFKDVDDLLNKTISDEEVHSAEKYIEENKESYKEFTKIKVAYNAWKNKASTVTVYTGDKIKTNGFAMPNTSALWGDRLSLLGYGVLWDGTLIDIAHKRQAETCKTEAEPIVFRSNAEKKDTFKSWLNKNDKYKTAVRNWWNKGSGNNSKENKAKFLMSILLDEKSNPIAKNMPKKWSNDVINYFNGYFNGTDDKLLDLVIELMGRNYYGEYYYVGADDKVPSNKKKYPVGGKGSAKFTVEVEEPVYKNGKVVKKKKVKKEVTWKPTNHKYYFIDSGNNAIEIENSVVKSYYNICFCNWQGFTLSDWLTDRALTIMQKYDEMVDLTFAYDNFIKTFNNINANTKGFNPKKSSMTGIAYGQCLIKNTGKSGQCISNKYGEDSTYTVERVYASTRVRELTVDFNYSDYFGESNKGYWTKNTKVYESRTKLTKYAATEVINRIKDVTSSAYSEVMGNIIKLIILNANSVNDRGPNDMMNAEDDRIMPFDVSALTPEDQENYSTSDPRVNLYRKNIIGSFVADLNLNIGGIFAWFRPQATLLNIIGKVSELSVFMQQICSFDLLDSWGLSPTTMWNSAFGLLLMSALALFFVVKTIKAVIGVCTSSSSSDAKIFISFLVLIVELGIITFIYINPERTWNFVKKYDTMVMNLGEMATVSTDNNFKYLYGDKNDLEVTYYLIYLDAWSSYNTGYAMTDDQQLIKKDGTPEVLNMYNPGIGNNDIKHWSILLADSFEYHGKSNSPFTSITEKDSKGNNHVINGPYINNNAYRVVDHFMAPRVKFTETNGGKNIKMQVTQNENYNGKFQSGFDGLLVKLLIALFMCFMSLVKLLTFFWQWYLIYVLFFRVILGKMAENKTWKEILAQTFAPTVAIFFIGLYTGTVFQVAIRLSGLVGIVIMLGLFIVTFKLLGWWYELKRGTYFPMTLKPIYAIVGREQINKAIKKEKGIREGEMLDEEWANMSFAEQYDYLYDENGNMRNERKNAKDRYRRAEFRQRLNRDLEGIDQTTGRTNLEEYKNKHAGENEANRNLYKNFQKIMDDYDLDRIGGVDSRQDIEYWKHQRNKFGFSNDKHITESMHEAQKQAKIESGDPNAELVHEDPEKAKNSSNNNSNNNSTNNNSNNK